MSSPVQGAWARALGGSSLTASPGLVTSSSRGPPSASPAAAGAARSSSAGVAGVHADGLLVVLESVGELQRELAPLSARVDDLEARLAASEAASEALRAELQRVSDTNAVLMALVTRLAREDSAEETARLRGALGGGGTGGGREVASAERRAHGRVRTLGGGGN